MGSFGLDSTIGSVGGTPYTAQEDEKTKSRTSLSSTASMRASADSTLLRKYLRGLVTDSPTYAEAAKCITASTCLRHERSFSLSAISPSTSSNPWDSLRNPVERLS